MNQKQAQKHVLKYLTELFKDGSSYVDQNKSTKFFIGILNGRTYKFRLTDTGRTRNFAHLGYTKQCVNRFIARLPIADKSQFSF